MQVHGKVCAVETRGPKHSLFLSVYGDSGGRRYIIRRHLRAKQFNDFKVLDILVR